jgi:hypothetical protein
MIKWVAWNCFSWPVLWFWATIAILLLFAYPTPELGTPSFEFHTAFNGVVFGIVNFLNSMILFCWVFKHIST